MSDVRENLDKRLAGGEIDRAEYDRLLAAARPDAKSAFRRFMQSKGAKTGVSIMIALVVVFAIAFVRMNRDIDSGQQSCRETGSSPEVCACVVGLMRQDLNLFMFLPGVGRLFDPDAASIQATRERATAQCF